MALPARCCANGVMRWALGAVCWAPGAGLSPSTVVRGVGLSPSASELDDKVTLSRADQVSRGGSADVCPPSIPV